MIKPRDSRLSPIEEMKNNKRRILVFEKEGGFLFFVVANKRIIHFGICEDDKIEVGDVYIGKISNIVKNINSYFVEVKRKQNCFLELETVNDAIILNRNSSNGLQIGDEIIVQIKKEAYKSKLAVCSAKIDKSNIDDQLLEQAKHMYPYTTLYKSPSELNRYLTSNPLLDDEYVVCENEIIINKIRDNYQVHDNNIKLHNDPMIRMSVLYGMEKMIDLITNKKVWLPCGGNIVIEPTEALTVIDVNSGKYISKGNREDTILNINLEALDEIIYQINARNLSGIIIIDFINMKDDKNKTILQHECKLRFDSSDSKVIYVEYTKLGLVEATRPKKNINIYELFNKIDKTILL